MIDVDVVRRLAHATAPKERRGPFLPQAHARHRRSVGGRAGLEGDDIKATHHQR